MQRRLLLQWWPCGGQTIRGGHQGGGSACGCWGVGRLLVFTERAVKWIHIFILLKRHLLLIYVVVLSVLPVHVALLFGIQRALFPSIFQVAPLVAVDALGVLAIPARGILFAVADRGVAGVVGLVFIVELGASQALAVLSNKLLAELRAASTQLARRGVTTVCGTEGRGRYRHLLY